MPNNKNSTILTSVLGLTLMTTGVASADSQTAQPSNKAAGTVSNTVANTATVKTAQQKTHKMGKDKTHTNKSHKGWQQGGANRHNLDALNLTETQKTHLNTLREQHKTKIQQLKAQLDQYNTNIAAMGTNDKTALLKLYQQKHAIHAQMIALRQQQQQQFLNILTPDQQLQWYQSHGKGDKKIERNAQMPAK